MATLSLALASCSAAVTDTQGDSATGDSSGDGGGDLGTPLVFAHNQNVDILFVVDDSHNMAEAQRRLALGLEAFIAALDEELGTVNLRIGFTSTDDGHYWCDGDESEAGQLLASSCRERLDDFSRESTGLAAETVCTDVCSLETIALRGTPSATGTAVSVRPWLERTAGVTNLPAGVSLTDAARCIAPLGIRGCGFESHLNSMWKALALSGDETQAQRGFLREDALLAIVFITNEAECSSTRSLQPTTFGLEGPNTRVFWTLPDQQDAPPSAVCWNAGVDCDFTAELDQCVAVDKSVDGSLAPEPPALSAMEPLSKYMDQLEAIEFHKRALNPEQGVLVAGIVGVPLGFPRAEALDYEPGPDSDDPDSFQARFGIGPGCESDAVEGVPPVRLRTVAERFPGNSGHTNLYSVCEPDYAPALASIGATIRAELAPSCIRACVADDEPDITGLQPRCSIRRSFYDGEGLVEEDVPPCDANGGPPSGAFVCHQLLTEDKHPRCADEGWNAEVRLVFPPGVPTTPGSLFVAECALSEDRELDCPDLPY